MRYLSVLLITLLLQGFTFVPGPDSEWLDYETCRQLVETNEILSVAELTEKVEPLALGNVIDMMLLKNKQQYIYEVEVAGNDGVVRMLYVDAKTGRLLGSSQDAQALKKESLWHRIINYSQ
ncbi:MAG: PepSY domain-containing protein [Amphritea sp.]